MAPKSLPTVSSLFIHLAFWPIHLPKKKNRWALSHDFKLVPFFFMFMFYSKRMVWAPFCLVYFSRMFLPWEMNLSRRVLWNSQIKIVKLSLVLKIWEEWYNKCIITWCRAGTTCFFGMLTTVFLLYLKTNFRLKCLQTSLTCISLC